MILCIQLILIIVLILILTSLYLEEKLKKRDKSPAGKLIQVWDGSERRRFVRIPIDVSVRYSFSKEQNNIKAIKTKDISIGGICVTINEKLSPKTGVCLEIECHASSTPILAKGEVVWVKENTEQKNDDSVRLFNVGIEFKDILPKERERLFKFIKECGQTQNLNGQN